MYHVLVCQDGEWVSFGLHLPNPQWTEIFQVLQRTFGNDNVSYTFWGEGVPSKDGFNIADHAKHEARLANEAQAKWDSGMLAEADHNGQLNLARGISLLAA